jgi:putative sigma-54 modulation protein
VQIRVSARHTTVSERDRRLIQEKIERLSKFLPGMERAEIHFSEERNPRIADKEFCEITLEGHGHHVRAKTYAPDHVTAVDLAIEKLENKLHKLKTKLARKPRHKTNGAKWKGATELPDDLLETMSDGTVATDVADYEIDVEVEEVELDGSGMRIVKTKKVEKLTLNPYDAAERMELVSHDFYFFTNADTGRAAVVYRRDDGDVGLIDEEG